MEEVIKYLESLESRLATMQERIEALESRVEVLEADLEEVKNVADLEYEMGPEEEEPEMEEPDVEEPVMPEPEPVVEPAPQPVPQPQPTPALAPEPVKEEPASPKAMLYGKPVDDIRLAISLGDRFLYQRELFGQNAELMQRTLTELNELGSFDEAVSYISRFNWDTESNTYQQFIVTLHRRFG